MTLILLLCRLRLPSNIVLFPVELEISDWVEDIAPAYTLCVTFEESKLTLNMKDDDGVTINIEVVYAHLAYGDYDKFEIITAVQVRI